MILNNADNIALGNTDVSKVYVGDELVWTHTSYRQVEYIKSTGTQCIKTDIVPEATYKTVVDMKFDDYLQGSSGWVFGTNRYNVIVYYRSWGMREMAFYAGYGWYEGIDDSKTTIYYLTSLSYLFDRTTIVLNRGASSFGSTTRTADVPISGTIVTGMSFFGYTDTATSVTPYPVHSLRIYGAKIYDSSNQLIHDLIPVERSDGELGLYDSITNKFYGNAGTGTFEKGSYVS